MKPHWMFNDRRKKDPIRDPIQGEFFANEAIKNPEEALIREGIQNSLDAAIKDGTEDPIRIRIFLATGAAAAPAKDAKRFMQGAWPHLNARGNGIRTPPSPDHACPFLVFEDFKTCGLNGDVTQSDEEKGNLFFYFFRAEGRSEKLGEKRGRWGVGKHVFPSASQINSIFGLTVRSQDGSRYLMGRSVLKCHQVNDKAFMPDGYFGLPDKDGFVDPTDDESVIADFCSTFRITRTNETGLSILMPWVNPTIEARELVAAVLRGYFYPILEGALIVTIEADDFSATINDVTITELTNKFLEKNDADLRPLLGLAKWAAFAKPDEFTILNSANPDRPIWNQALLPQDKIESLKKRFETGDRIALRAPLTVRFKEKGKQTEASHLDIFIARDGYELGKPTFVREGIIISGVKAPLVRGVRSLVVASQGALATLLGDAENPSHTEWLSASAHFGEKYTYGRSYLDFVTRSVHEFVRLLTAGDRKGNPLLLLNLFSLPSDDETGISKPGAKKKNNNGTSDDHPKPPPPLPKKFRVERVKGGFSILKGDGELVLPMKLIVRAAYDVRRGNALGKYKPADFSLVRPPVYVESQTGVKLQEDGPNRLTVEVTQQDFQLALGGFDSRRDLFVKVDEQKATDD